MLICSIWIFFIILYCLPTPTPLSHPHPCLEISGMFQEVSKEINVS